MSRAQSVGVTLLRIGLGVIFVMHGYLGLAVLGPSAIASYTVRMGYPPALAMVLAWYLIVVHLGGGILVLVGFWTRGASLLQLPIMASALLLLHLPQGFFLHGIVLDAAEGSAIAGGYEYVLLVVLATIALALLGGGALSLDRLRR